MTKNVGSWDRIARAVAASLMTTCAVMAPLPLLARLGLFALPAIYMAFTALLGSCVGYRLMGRSTCPVADAR